MQKTLNIRIYYTNPVELLKTEGKWLFPLVEITPETFVEVKCKTYKPISTDNEDIFKAVGNWLKSHFKNEIGIEFVSDLSFNEHTLYFCKINGDYVHKELYLYVETYYEIPHIQLPEYKVLIKGYQFPKIVTEYVLRQMLIDNALGLVEFSILSCEPEQPEHKYYAEVKNGSFSSTPIDLEGKASMSLLTDLKFKLLKLIHKQTKIQDK